MVFKGAAGLSTSKAVVGRLVWAGLSPGSARRLESQAAPREEAQGGLQKGSFDRAAVTTDLRCIMVCTLVCLGGKRSGLGGFGGGWLEHPGSSW